MAIRSRFVQFCGAAALGAGLAHFFDPDRGRSRRTRARDQLLSLMRRSVDTAERRSRYMAGQVEGLRARADGHGKMDPADDHVIKQGIEHALAATTIETTNVVIDVTDGVVGLRGQVNSPSEIHEVHQVVEEVPGVEEIESWLHLPGQPAPNKVAAIKATMPT